MTHLLRPIDFTVGWISALSIELAAAQEMLDEQYEDLPQAIDDTNIYTYGRIGLHNVVLACLPAGQTGTNSAAGVVMQMKSTFRGIRFGLMVGIGGGVPSKDADIRLGDIVISQPGRGHGGVIQYDMGKSILGGFTRTGFLDSPPRILLSAVAKLRANHDRGKSDLSSHISKINKVPKFARDRAGSDVLFEGMHNHVGGNDCKLCDNTQQVQREVRKEDTPEIHYGTIASGNQVMKYGTERDQVSSEFGGVLCFEMEAAGLMNNFPCLVIRGICDYADSHKNKKWQGYAAGTAAACAKELLSTIPAVDVVETRSVEPTRGPIYADVTYKVQDLSFFKTSNYESYKNINPKRVPETCAWFLEHPTFREWNASRRNNLLWVSADPGCGKSVLSRALVDEMLFGTTATTVCHFFFKENDEQNNAATALCALLHQFFCECPNLFDTYAAPAIKRCGLALKQDFEELWKILRSASSDPSAGEIIYLLDALDECQQADQEKLFANLEEFHRQSLTEADREATLKFLVTSRPYDGIERRFRRLTARCPTIWLAGEQESAKISREIEIVADARIKEIAQELDLRESARSSLLLKLCEIPNRTYLWLHLTLDEIRNALGRTEKKLQKVIETLPRTVEEAYEKILSRCKKTEAKRVLEIVVAVGRPLTLGEIDVALEIGWSQDSPRSYTELDLENENRSKWIRKACGLFVSIIDSRVFLIHQTAREFLIRQNDEIHNRVQWKSSVDLEKAHQTLSTICITYLHFKEFQGSPVPTQRRKHYDKGFRTAIKRFTEEHPFLDYSANFWTYHVQEARVREPGWIANSARLCDVDGSSSFWFQIYEMSHYLPYRHGYMESSPLRASNLYWAAVLGLESETRFLLATESDPNAQGGYYGNALQAAAYGGQEDIVKDLLSSGANINLEGGKYNTALQAACDRGHARIVAVFLYVLLSYKSLIDVHAKKAFRLSYSSAAELQEPVTITSETVEAGAKSQDNGDEVIALLLNRRGHEVSITKEVLEAAAGNWKSGKEILTLFFDRQGDALPVTEEVVKAAAANEQSGVEVMTLLFDRCGDALLVTEEVVKAAAANEQSGVEVMTLLFDRRGDALPVTEEVVKAAAANRQSGVQILTLLFDRRGDALPVTEEVVKAAANSWKSGKQILTLLFDRCGDALLVTEEVVKAAANNWKSGKQILTLLFDRRGDALPVTEE
ncbi:MAG: hypothetical protein Q9157_002326, partial [Trypethelium eluteriae]